MSDSDQNPSKSNEFTINYEADPNIRLLKQEIETWKQKYEDAEAQFEAQGDLDGVIQLLNQDILTMENERSDLKRNFEDQIKLLNEEIRSLEQWKEDYRTENMTLWKEVERLNAQLGYKNNLG